MLDKFLAGLKENRLPLGLLAAGAVLFACLLWMGGCEWDRIMPAGPIPDRAAKDLGLLKRKFNVRETEGYYLDWQARVEQRDQKWHADYEAWKAETERDTEAFMDAIDAGWARVEFLESLSTFVMPYAEAGATGVGGPAGGALMALLGGGITASFAAVRGRKQRAKAKREGQVDAARKITASFDQVSEDVIIDGRREMVVPLQRLRAMQEALGVDRIIDEARKAPPPVPPTTGGP